MPRQRQHVHQCHAFGTERIVTFRVERATRENAAAIAPMLTELALSEIAAIGAKDPADAVGRLAEGSAYSFCGLDEDGPMFLGGAVPMPGHEGAAFVWMVMTSRVATHRLTCLRAMRREAEIMSARWRVLMNYTDDRHPRTQAWLEWLGFTVGESMAHPLTGAIVRPFERRLEHV